jgi:hypothetical protein
VRRNDISDDPSAAGDFDRLPLRTVDQFTNSAAGDYTLAANDGGSNQDETYKRAVDYGVVIPGITDGYTGSAPRGAGPAGPRTSSAPC